MYKFQIRKKGRRGFWTIASFYNNPEYEDIFFIHNLLVSHFEYHEERRKKSSRHHFSVDVDFYDYSFDLNFTSRGKRKIEEYEFRYFKVDEGRQAGKA